jgi:hypothetical protein
MSKHFKSITYINRDALHLMYTLAVAVNRAPTSDTILPRKDILRAIQKNNSNFHSRIIGDIRGGFLRGTPVDFREITRDLDSCRNEGRI